MSKRKLYSDIVAGKNVRALYAWAKRTRESVQAAGEPDRETIPLVDAYQTARRDAIGLRAYIWAKKTPDAAPAKGEDFLGRCAKDQKAMLAELKALDALSAAHAARLAVRGIEVPAEAK